jgi:type VI secretion system Hcp family effector
MAFHGYVSFKGAKQSAFKGESAKAARKDKGFSDILSVSQSSSVNVDPKTGLPKGSRTHRPIVLIKERGASSPQICQAHWTGETLTEVVIELAGRPASGQGEIVVERITLTNATISELKRYSPTLSGEVSEHSTDFLDEISLVFTGIKIEDPVNSTSTSDDWTQNDK